MQMNLFFLLLTLNMYLSVGHVIKSTKQLKYTLNNIAVSLTHVHVTWVSEHSLINPQTIECAPDHSDWNLTRRKYSWLKLLWGRGPRAGYDGRVTKTPVFKKDHSKFWNAFEMLSYLSRFEIKIILTFLWILHLLWEEHVFFFSIKN